MGHSIAGKSCSTAENVNVSRIVLAKYLGMSYSGLTSTAGLHTFVFDMLILGGMFTILVVRENDYFWESIPSKTLMTAICVYIVVTFAISIFGIPGLIQIAARYR